jgi:alpha-galactosidase
MTRKNEITERPEVVKVSTDFHDLGMWGEYYGFILHLSNGQQFTVRVQEHEFEAFERQIKMQPKVTELTDQQEKDFQADQDNISPVSW